MSLLQYHNIYEKKNQQIPLDFSFFVLYYPFHLLYPPPHFPRLFIFYFGIFFSWGGG